METQQTTTRTVVPSTETEILTALREDLGEIELDVLTSYTLADAIREGSGVTGQLHGGYASGNLACALQAGYYAAKARGYIAE